MDIPVENTSPPVRRAALVFIFITLLIDILSFGLIIPVLPHLIKNFVGGDTSLAAWWYMAFAVVFMAMQFVFTPVQGALADRFGRRPIILASNLGLGLEFLMMALVNTLPLLFIGRVISGLPAHRVAAGGVIHVPQGDLLFAGMSVLENLLMGAYLDSDQAAVVRRLDVVFSLLPKLAERQTQIAASLSGGERRMVGIGRGLMMKGTVMLIDEPSLGLAPIIIEQIYEVIAQLKASGRTILLVEENPARVADLADQRRLRLVGRTVRPAAARRAARNLSRRMIIWRS